MSITNITKPSTTLANATKIGTGEIWDTASNQWQNESRTWQDMASLLSNITVGVTGFLWSAKRTPWLEATPWQSEGGISNISKPA